jgi:hypothetical protein
MTMLSPYLEETAKNVARALKIDPYFVRWEQVAPLYNDEALVVHTPWARVVVARYASGADQFVSDYLTGHCLWLLDALEAAYPEEASPTLHPERLLEIPVMDPALRGFRKWALSASPRAAWQATPFTQVVGSWTTYRDGVLLRHADGRCVLRVRNAPSPSLGVPYVQPNSSGLGPLSAQMDQLHRSSRHNAGPSDALAV